MILADVNTLVYAFNADGAEYESHSAWLTDTLSGREGFALVDTVLSGFVRVVTHPRIWAHPAATGEATRFVHALVAAPVAYWLPAGDEVWTTFQTLVSNDQGIRGNVVPDAYLAAVALNHGARIATADRGFARFPGLKWFDPASGQGDRAMRLTRLDP